MCFELWRKLPVALAALFLGAFLCFGQTAGKRPQTGSRLPALNEVLSWLPADTETVMGTNGPFLLSDLDALSDTISSPPELLTAELELRMEALPLALLDLKKSGLQDFLKDKKVALAVEGSRRFRPPGVPGGFALGEMSYEGCEIITFTDATLDGDSFMKSVASSAVRFEKIEGSAIAVLEDRQEDEVWTTFVAFPRNNTVLVASNLNYLRTVLARMRGAAGPRALPDTLPEWKDANTRAPAWGVRHYQRRDVQLDPTSPLQGQHNANIPDMRAIGTTFWFEPADRKMVTVTYLSANGKARKILQDHLGVADAATASPREFQIRLRQPIPGVIQGSVALTGSEAFYRLLLGLMAMVGHGVYL